MFACTVLAAFFAASPALADCSGASIYFGNLGGLAWERLDLSDPRAFWLTYIFEDPSINQGPVPPDAVAADLGLYGGEPGTAAVFGDWGAELGMAGCPFTLDNPPDGNLDNNNVHQVFVFGDSRGATIAVATSTGGAFDLDPTHPSGGALTASTLRPFILRAHQVADGIAIDLQWDPAVVNADTASAELASRLVDSYRILERRQGGSSVSERVLQDRDGNPLDTRAAVLLCYGTIGQSSQLFVEPRLDSAQGVGIVPPFRGTASSPILVGAGSGSQDRDADGFLVCEGDCDDTRASVYPGAPEVCDLRDNDCDGWVDEGVVFDPQPEICDGQDNDCNGVTDDIDLDGDGFFACGPDCDDANPNVRPGAAEACNLADDDCDGSIDEGLGQTTCGVGACRRTVDNCVGGVTQFCAPGEPSPETCDGLDNDCDGVLDNLDADGDGFSGCGPDCNDRDPAINPAAAEICNGIDDDCDSRIDEDEAGLDSDGDSIPNACDNCRFAINAGQVDTDGDRVGNACDNCVLVANRDQADLDADGRGAVCDNCPGDFNPPQDDSDADAVGDVCDNCLFIGNPGQQDRDADGEGDLCDLDDGEIWFSDLEPEFVAWQPELGFGLFHLYRGSAAVLRATGEYAQDPAVYPEASRFCGLTDTFVPDDFAPLPERLVFYLVTGVAGGVESTLGTDSAGTVRPNAHPCP